MESLDDGETQCLWNLYYNLHVSKKELAMLHAHTESLVKLSESVVAWQAGKYSLVFNFHNDSTREQVRKVWQYYLSSSTSAADNTALRKHFENTMSREDWHKKAAANGMALVFDLRSALPVDIRQSQYDLREVRKHFDRSRTLGLDSKEILKHKLPNPMFLSANAERFLLDWTTQPLSGYHMAGRYISKPIKRKFDSADAFTFAQEAQKQFRSWIAAFRDQIKRTKISVNVSDSLAFCESLHRQAVEANASSGLFNLIDTANLIDFYGPIDLLVHAVPLLEHSPATTLHTDLLRRDGVESVIKTVSCLLVGDLKTMSLLFGLQLIDSLTNLSFVAPIEEYLMSTLANNKMEPHQLGQYYHRLTWKVADTQHCSLRLDSEAMQTFLLDVYKKMFAKRDLMTQMNQHLRARSGPSYTDGESPRESRATFAGLLSFLMSRHWCDWDPVIAMIVLSNEMMGNLFDMAFLQELYIHLHFKGLHTSIRIQGPANHVGAESLQRWHLSGQSVPGLAYITLRIPRSCLKPFEDLSSDPIILGNPHVQAMISGSEDLATDPWESRFACLQICFGRFRSTGNFKGLTGKTIITRDPTGWASRSDMLVIFPAPTYLLLQDPATAIVGLALRTGAHEIKLFFDKFTMLKIFHARLEDGSHVALSRSPPTFEDGLPESMANLNMNHSPAVTPLPPQLPPAAEQDRALKVGFSQGKVVNSLTARVEIPDGPALLALRDKGEASLGQLNPFCLSLTIRVNDETHSLQQSFPLPVSSQRSKMRIARKSGYIEVVAAILSLDEDGEQDEVFAHCNGHDGMLRSVPYVDLDVQPSISPRCSTLWVDGMTNMQLSRTEKHYLEHQVNEGVDADLSGILPRTQLKSTLMNTFNAFIGVKEPKQVAFGIKDPDVDGEFRMILLLADMKLDAGNQTPLLDAALIYVPSLEPSTKSKLLSGILSKSKDSVFNGVDATHAELKLWYRLLPLFAERCRRWQHTTSCGWARRSTATLMESWSERKNPLCTCGNGVFPAQYPVIVDGWKDAQQYATRVAISPVYFVPFIDQVGAPRKIPPGHCIHCRKAPGNEAAKFPVCARCKQVSYCSKKCQKEDWREHKSNCEALKALAQSKEGNQG